MTQSFTERLLSLKHPDESQTHFLARAHLQRADLHRWRQNEARSHSPGINLYTIIRLAYELRVTPAWLAFGVGQQSAPR